MLGGSRHMQHDRPAPLLAHAATVYMGSNTTETVIRRVRSAPDHDPASRHVTYVSVDNPFAAKHVPIPHIQSTDSLKRRFFLGPRRCTWALILPKPSTAHEAGSAANHDPCLTSRKRSQMTTHVPQSMSPLLKSNLLTHSNVRSSWDPAGLHGL